MNYFLSKLGADENQKKLFNLLFVFIFAGIFVFSIWRAPFGYVSPDESLYLTIPYRIIQGDSFVFHEWNPSQMSAVLLLPLVKLYYVFVPSGEGIFLAFRYIYIHIHCLVAVCIYISLSKKAENRCAAIAAAAFYQMSCYLNIMALSYNSMSIGLMVITCLILSGSNGKLWELVLAGSTFAGAVICCPFLVFVYMAYSVLVLGRRLYRKKNPALDAALSVRSWAVITAVCASLALLFVGSIIANGDIDTMLEILPQILSDEDHPARSLPEIIQGLYYTFARFNAFFKPVFAGSLVLPVLIFFDKKRVLHSAWYVAAAAVLAFVFSLTYLLMYREPEYMLFPICILGLFSYMVCEKKPLRLFCLMYLPGIMYCLCMYASSNMGLRTICGASAVSMVASFVFVFQAVSEIWQRQGRTRIAKAFNLVAVLLPVFLSGALFCGLFLSRVEAANYENELWGLSAEITQGSAKGVKTTPDKAWVYEQNYKELEFLRNIEEGNVLYFTAESSRYIEDPKRCASFSVWLSPGSNKYRMKYLDKLEQYWGLFPEKFPDYVFIPKEYAEDKEFFDRWNKYGFRITTLENSVVLCDGNIGMIKN